MTDRTVHGLTENGAEIVRYDRAGKWYIERAGFRQPVTVAKAAEKAAEGRHYERRPGGKAFDAQVRRVRAALNDKEAEK